MVLRLSQDYLCGCILLCHFFPAKYTLETMWDFLVPSELDDFIAAALAVSMPNMEDLRVPSNALKLKYDTVKSEIFAIILFSQIA